MLSVRNRDREEKIKTIKDEITLLDEQIPVIESNKELDKALKRKMFLEEELSKFTVNQNKDFLNKKNNVISLTKEPINEDQLNGRVDSLKNEKWENGKKAVVNGTQIGLEHGKKISAFSFPYLKKIFKFLFVGDKPKMQAWIKDYINSNAPTNEFERWALDGKGVKMGKYYFKPSMPPLSLFAAIRFSGFIPVGYLLIILFLIINKFTKPFINQSFTFDALLSLVIFSLLLIPLSKAYFSYSAKKMYVQKQIKILPFYENIKTFVHSDDKNKYEHIVDKIKNFEGGSPVLQETQNLEETAPMINPLNTQWEEFLKYVINKQQHEKIILPSYESKGETDIHIFDIPILPFQKFKENVQFIESFTKRTVYQILKDYKGIGTVGVELVVKEPPTMFDYDFVKIQMNDPLYKDHVVVGLDAKGKVLWNFKKVPHAIFSGTTGSGKTVALMNVVEQFKDRGFMMYFIDFKKEEFAFLRKKGYEVATERVDAVNLIERIENEVDYRQKQRESGSNQAFTPVFLIIDEFADITGTKDDLMNRSMEKLKRIAAQGRTVSVHLIIATQRPSAESLGSTDFRNNLGFRLVGKLKDASSSNVALDNDFAFSRLPESEYGGMFIVKSSQNSPDDSVVRAPFVEKYDFINYVIENWTPNPYQQYTLGKNKDIQTSNRLEEKEKNPLDSKWRELIKNEFGKFLSKYKTPEVVRENGTEIHLLNIEGITSNDYEKKKKNIEVTTKMNVYKIHQNYNNQTGVTGIELTSGTLPSLISYDEIPYIDHEPVVYVGKDVKGWVEWDLDDMPSGLIVGISKSGKSALTNSIINQIQRKGKEFMMVFADLKGGLELSIYGEKKYHVVDNVDDFAELTQVMVNEMDERLKIWKRLKAKNYKGYKKKAIQNGEEILPRILFIIDEFARATGNPDKNISEPSIKNIDLLLSQCRAVGIHLLLVTQKPSVKSLGSSEAKDNLQVKIASRLSESGSNMIFGDDRASIKIPANDFAGKVLAIGLNSEDVMRTPFMEDELFEEMVFTQWNDNPYANYSLGKALILDQPKKEIVEPSHLEIKTPTPIKDFQIVEFKEKITHQSEIDEFEDFIDNDDFLSIDSNTTKRKGNFGAASLNRRS
ncbi:FtsK/SpoIIIE domain-containing protein [Bacillus badius]|uniref:FtsK/SpoIIIE domain-containing protein n=1 Tax=Bacillus badius TaxID=1455 RepID=UPI0007B392BC|nr:FtsK/SpoIIIE domain-containing protein [Bacillus badius]KZR59332.1 hypothetical protein A3781_13100 [Bacillus badius]